MERIIGFNEVVFVTYDVQCQLHLVLLFDGWRQICTHSMFHDSSDWNFPIDLPSWTFKYAISTGFCYG